MAPRSPQSRPSAFVSFVSSLLMFAAPFACGPDVTSAPPPTPPPPMTVPSSPPEPAKNAEPPAGPASAEPRPTVAVVDRTGALLVLDGAGTVLASCAGRGTDVIATGRTVATFEPSAAHRPGAVRIFALSGSALQEQAARPVTSETGGLVAFLPGGGGPVFTGTVLAWEEGERASLLLVDASEANGVGTGSPASIRRALLPDGSPSVEVLVTASGAPRIDRFRVHPGGVLVPEDDFAVPVAPDAAARMVAAPDARLLVSLEGGSVFLRDETGGEEIGPAVAAGATLEEAAARDGRLVLLLGSPARLLVRDLTGVYFSRPLAGPLPADPRPAHRLALDTESVFVITGAGLARLPWAEATTTADEAPETMLVGAVAVAPFSPD